VQLFNLFKTINHIVMNNPFRNDSSILLTQTLIIFQLILMIPRANLYKQRSTNDGVIDPQL